MDATNRTISSVDIIFDNFSD